MKKISQPILMVILVILLTLTASCTWVIEDSPELRQRMGESVLPTLTPEPCLDIKGNVTASGELIYHVPGQANYNTVKPEAYFCTEAEAQTAGYRKSRR